MKRTTRAVAVSAAAALLLSACGGGSNTTETPSSTGDTASAGDAAENTAEDSAAETDVEAAPADDAESTEAPVRDANAELVIWADNDRAEALKEFAKQFGDEYGITTQVQVSTDVRAQFSQAHTVGQGPDIIVGAHDWLGEFVQNGSVAPVPLADDVQAQFVPESIEATKFDGQIYGVPYATENLALMRNTDLAPNVPATMEELVAHGAELVEAGDADAPMGAPVGLVGDAYHAFPWLDAYGGGIFGQNADGGWDASKVIIDSPETIKGAEKMAWLAEEKALNVNMDGTAMAAMFAEGRLPYMITGPWSTTGAAEAGINYAISPIPEFQDGGKPLPFLGVQMFYVSSDAKNPAMAQEFVNQYVPSADLQMAMYENAGERAPALLEALEEVSAKDEDLAGFSEAGKGAPPMPNIPQMASVWQPLGQATADIIGGDDVESRLKDAQKEIVANIG
ncbi:sugar ABC transporter substrate-binding protein [Ornithinimicrobium tianjinense]|uniref:Sugar ABC transporter substrate-binding protein n=1 Tax=Ornithinimicrobium tianjinense TaxID=1195761 RepID=A0A917BRI8_9MICO|nr:maltose ABC transporter substrate-binding protein [Ornithinimicrobium tianjinense]GGF56284.1 sugar ABC transporter substrate-binding protein [Ornithinimicrobium tianjinense]